MKCDTDARGGATPLQNKHALGTLKLKVVAKKALLNVSAQAARHGSLTISLEGTIYFSDSKISPIFRRRYRNLARVTRGIKS